MPADPAPSTAAIDARLQAAAENLGEAIRRGELVTFPTDTVVALAADWRNETALARVYAVKHREPRKSIPILVANLDAVPDLVASFPDPARSLAAAFWPGGLTIVLTARLTLPAAVTTLAGDGTPTVAIRMPAHPLALAILAAAGGAAAATSANISGETPAPTAAAARLQLGPDVSHSLDAGFPVSQTASTIVDLTGPAPRIIRAGAITLAMIEQVIAALSSEIAPPAMG